MTFELHREKASYKKEISQLGLVTGKYFSEHCHNQHPMQTGQKVVSVRLKFII